MLLDYNFSVSRLDTRSSKFFLTSLVLSGCVVSISPRTNSIQPFTILQMESKCAMNYWRGRRLDGLHETSYDDHTITFIGRCPLNQPCFVSINTSSASKCDDISCSEVVRALGIHDEPELEEIETRIENIENEMSVWKQTEAEAQKHVKGLLRFGISDSPLQLTATSYQPRA